MAFGADAVVAPDPRDGVHAICLWYGLQARYDALPRPLVELIDGLLSVDPAHRLDIAGAAALL